MSPTRGLSILSLALAGSLALFSAGEAAERSARPYVIFTTDGHRLMAQSRPEIRGLEAYLRLLPRGQLAVIKEELIDWERTEAANKPPAPIVIPADATMVEGEDASVPPAEPPASGIAIRREHHHRQRDRRRLQERREALSLELERLERQGTAPTGGSDDAGARAERIRKTLVGIDEQISRLDARIRQLEDAAANLGIELE